MRSSLKMLTNQFALPAKHQARSCSSQSPCMIPRTMKLTKNLMPLGFSTKATSLATAMASLKASDTAQAEETLANSSQWRKWSLIITLWAVCSSDARWWSRIQSDTKLSWLNTMALFRPGKLSLPRCMNASKMLWTIVHRSHSRCSTVAGWGRETTQGSQMEWALHWIEMAVSWKTSRALTKSLNKQSRTSRF